MMNNDQRPTTADLARAGEDVRGSSDERIINRDARVDEPRAATTIAATDNRPQPRADRPAAPEPNAPLFAQNDSDRLRAQWSDIQAGFVDQPRDAVERADKLVADVMKRLAESFARERDTLDRQWDHGDNVTTEDLRLVLQRYRSFFDRLLSV